jgi:hypothetical protein
VYDQIREENRRAAHASVPATPLRARLKLPALAPLAAVDRDAV